MIEMGMSRTIPRNSSMPTSFHWVDKPLVFIERRLQNKKEDYIGEDIRQQASS
jgi:hypothetical protein